MDMRAIEDESASIQSCSSIGFNESTGQLPHFGPTYFLHALNMTSIVPRARVPDSTEASTSGTTHLRYASSMVGTGLSRAFST